MYDIILENVDFTYDRQKVLENINFSLTREDFLAIIGPNGGGKSTLLKLILGLLDPNKGKISIFGKNPRYNKNILSYVPQNTNVNQIFPITSLEVALMGRLGKKGLGFYSKEDKKKAKDALEKVGVGDLADEHISNLSGGQRQRVYIARALCCEAKLILLDEPTSSIDTDGQIQIYKLLKDLNKHLGIIVVSHNINISVSFANKVAHVNKNLYMHDVANLKAKQNIIDNIKSTNNHLCPVEIITQSTCNNPAHHEEI
ncbi:MAG: ABC transporter [Proteobacteria bacterium]|nr:MAG: ABC transporter [Pseudomonadota bacterium]